MAEKKSESVKVMLTRIEMKQDNLAAQLTTHLRHHWAATIVLLGSTASLITGLIILAVK
jgi:hypothetical protein